MLDQASFSRWKEAILAEYPRLGLDDTFRFGCGPGVKCFNACCADVNVFLTPYDVLRIKRKLGLDSRTFLERHTRTITLDARGIPLVQIRMNEDDPKACPFVGPEGCTVYEDRPWSCRMYPIGSASPAAGADGPDAFYFVVERFPACAGFDDEREWTVRAWKADQGIDEYEIKGEAFKAICLHKFFRARSGLTPDKTRMMHLACYDLDTFRRFVFESSFLRRFDVEPQTLERFRADDEALLLFGFRWLRFTLFGEKTLVMTDDAVEEGVQKMGKMFTK